MAVLAFQTHSSLFSNRPTESKPDSKQEKHPLLNAEEHALTLCLRYSFSMIRSG
jgi:hypothetical protein